MEPQLIESLRAYRTRLSADIAAPSFAQRRDRERVLARFLATDRLLAQLVEFLPPIGLEDAETVEAAR